MAVWAAGLIVADLTNPNSWLRQTIAWHRRIFDVEAINPIHALIDGVDHLLITVNLGFVKDAPGASLVLDIQSCKTPTLWPGAAPASIVYESNRSFVAGEKAKIVIATVPVKLATPGQPPPMPLPGAHYGPPEQPSPPQFVADSVNILTLVLKSGPRTQRYKLHLRSPMLNSSGFGRVFCMGEDYDAFDSVEGPAFH